MEKNAYEMGRSIDNMFSNYKHKLRDPIDYEGFTQHNDYYEECIQKGISRTARFIFKNELELRIMLNQLNREIFSIIYHMNDSITLTGCKELLTVCCMIKALVNGSSDEKEILDNTIGTIYSTFEIANKNRASNTMRFKPEIEPSDFFDLHQIHDLTERYSANSFYMHQLDFYLNFYLVSGNKNAIGAMNLLKDEIFKDINNNSNLMEVAITLKESLKRIEDICNLGMSIYKNGWNPPKTQFPKHTIYIERSNSHDYKMRAQSADKGHCYIATAVYGDYNCDNVRILRRYRDEILNKHYLGERLIALYYWLSPYIVKRFKGHEAIESIIKHTLDQFIEYINKKHFSSDNSE